ncbi:MAG: putative lipid II flippase FtsW [Magnetococcales bacterium]|nr:putative lipid II flippase FtsW [Magnetococcales bacterium]
MRFRKVPWILRFDFPLMAAAITLLLIGLVMVYSASTPMALKKFADPNHYALRNIVYASLGIFAMFLVSMAPIKVIRKAGVTLFWICLLMLLVVLIPGLGLRGGGAQRWINFGLFTIQPTEPFKVALVLFTAHFLAMDPSRALRIRGGLLPLLLLYGFAAMLMLREPDFGSTVISGAVLMGIIFVGGIPISWIAGLLMAAIPAAAAGVIMAPYRFARVTSFLDPWDDPLDSDFQLAQSLMAFGNGGFLGRGLGQGQQKHLYLPEAHTDFILAVIAEEMGFILVGLIILLFAFIVWRAFKIAQRHEEPFARLACSGLAMLLGFQTVANMGVVMGLLPPKGLTLPLISYGGSSLIITMCSIGLLLAFSRHPYDQA